jgi:hypothetical protein
MAAADFPRVLPIIHLNGSGSRNLLEHRSKMLRHLNGAIDAFSEATPHGRDYYPVPGLLEKAMAQHERRLVALVQLRDEIEGEALDIADLAEGRDPIAARHRFHMLRVKGCTACETSE